MTPAEIKARRVVALRLFYALRAHYPDKHVALSIPPRDVADDEHDGPHSPKDCGVEHANGQALACVYCEEEPGRCRSAGSARTTRQ